MAFSSEFPVVHFLKRMDYFSDAEGNIAENLPGAFVTMLFDPFEGQTKLISQTKYDSPEALQQVLDMSMEQGITETRDRLSEYLQSVQNA